MTEMENPVIMQQEAPENQNEEALELDENAEYSARNIRVLEGLEAVRKRPGMYIGGTGLAGLHHLVWEIVDNSIDEALAGHASTIHVNMHDDGSVSVLDDGRGIPTDIHEQTGKSALEVILTVLHSGGKFDKNSYKYSGGLHGVGISVVNALSEWLEVTVWRDGSVFQQSFKRGVAVSEMTVSEGADRTGTKIRFKPDAEIFESIEFSFDILSKRLRELAFLNKGIKIVLRQKAEQKCHLFEYEGGIASFVEFLNETKRNHKNTQLNLTHSHRFASGETLNTSMNYTGDKYTGQAENKDLTVQLNYRPVLKFMNMTVTANKFYDLDGDDYNLDNGYQLLNRLPEINFSFPAYTFPGVPLTLNFSGMYGHYEEGNLNDKKDTEKKDFRANFTVPTIQVHERFDITPSYNLLKSYYSGGIERENGTTMVRANHRFSKVTNLEFNYNVSTSKGKSPFQFDSFTSTDVFSTRLRFAENSWSLNPINFNYNRVSHRLEQVYWDYSRRSRTDAYRNWEFFIRRDYIPQDVSFSRFNLNALKPGTTNARYRMSSNLWSFDTSITYPHQYGRITNTSFNYQTTIRPHWKINTTGNYNHLAKKFSPLTIGIIRDLHCWEARAEYNHERKEFWIEFYLKAYPDDAGRFRYGMDDNKLEAKLAAYDQLTQRYEGTGY